jgi:Acetyltransferase (GNAT) domain
LPRRAVSTDDELQIDETLDFQFVRASRCSHPVIREIGGFLDTQVTSHPFQFPQWSGGEGGAYLAFLRHQGRLRWFAQCGVLYPASRLVRQIRAFTVNRGPICDDLEVMELGLRQLVAESRRRRIAYLEIAPEWTGVFADSAKTVLAQKGWQALPGARSSLRLDLSPDVEQLFASFRKATRYEIRRAERGGIKVTIARDETDFHDFVRLYATMLNQKKIHGEDPDFLSRQFRWLAADQSRGSLFLAEEDGTLRGGAAIFRAGMRCWYVWGATSKEGKFSSGHLLQWHAIQWAKEQGCLEYDFGGFREGMTTGPALFKRGFCDHVVHFLPPHRYVVSERRYRMLNFISGVRRSLGRRPSATAANEMMVIQSPGEEH